MHKVYCLSSYCVMPVLNVNIRILNKFAESITEITQFYFVPHTCGFVVFVLTRTVAICTKLTQLFLFLFLIDTRSTNSLCFWLPDKRGRPERKRNCALSYLSLFFYVFIFSISGWLIQESSTPPLPSFCSQSKFWFRL